MRVYLTTKRKKSHKNGNESNSHFQVVSLFCFLQWRQYSPSHCSSVTSSEKFSWPLSLLLWASAEGASIITGQLLGQLIAMYPCLLWKRAGVNSSQMRLVWRGEQHTCTLGWCPLFIDSACRGFSVHSFKVHLSPQDQYSQYFCRGLLAFLEQALSWDTGPY